MFQDQSFILFLYILINVMFTTFSQQILNNKLLQIIIDKVKKVILTINSNYNKY